MAFYRPIFTNPDPSFLLSTCIYTVNKVISIYVLCCPSTFIFINICGSTVSINLFTYLSVYLTKYQPMYLSIYFSVSLSMLSIYLSSKLHVSTSQFICNCTNTEAVPGRMGRKEAGQTGIFRFLGCEANYLSFAYPAQLFNPFNNSTSSW